MKTDITDRIVVEIMGDNVPSNTFVADVLRRIAYRIEEGYSGDDEDDEDISREPVTRHEVLWEHEAVDHSGLRMGIESLIHEAYYTSHEKAELFPSTMEDLNKLSIRKEAV